MKHSLVSARRARKGKLVQQLEEGQAPFRGARSPSGPKDPKDLRGSKGVLEREAEDLARGEERYSGEE